MRDVIVLASGGLSWAAWGILPGALVFASVCFALARLERLESERYE